MLMKYKFSAQNRRNSVSRYRESRESVEYSEERFKKIEL